MPRMLDRVAVSVRYAKEPTMKHVLAIILLAATFAHAEPMDGWKPYTTATCRLWNDLPVRCVIYLSPTDEAHVRVVLMVRFPDENEDVIGFIKEYDSQTDLRNQKGTVIFTHPRFLIGGDKS
jgi:adenylosuccinate synthase